MKKIVIFVFFVFISIGSIFANSDNLAGKNNSFVTFQLIQTEVDFFGHENNFDNYTNPYLTLFSDSGTGRAEKNKWIGFALNLAIGFGVGSFVQGDMLGGGLGLGMDLVGVGVVIGGVAMFYNDFNKELYSSRGLIMCWAGGFFLAASRIFQSVRPFLYANKYSVSVVPAFDNNGKPAVTAVYNYKY